MKSKLSIKVLGIVVTVATLASLLVGLVAAPVSAAAPGANAWTTTDTPSNVNNVLGGVNYTFPGGVSTKAVIGNPDINLVAASPDGKTIFGWDDTNKAMYKSTDGINWGTTVGINTLATAVALDVSPNFATDGVVVLATTSEVWASTNSGGAFSSINPSDLAVKLGSTTPSIITSMDVGYWYTTNNVMTILLGTRGTGVGAGVATSHVLDLAWTGGSGWSSVGTMANDVYAVKFSNSALTDGEIMAVYYAGGNLTLSSDFGTLGWSNISYPDKVVVGSLLAAPTSVAIALPTDYVGNTGASIFIGTVGANIAGPVSVDDVYRVYNRSSAAGSVVKTGLALSVTGIAVNGPIATATVFATVGTGVVQRSANITASATSITWSTSKGITGTNAQVAIAGTAVYAGTTGNDSAISVSNDGGVSFQQVGVIDVGPLSGGQLQVSLVNMTAVDANTMFVVMKNTSFVGAGQYVFKTVNAGAAWQRVYTSNVLAYYGNISGLVLMSPSTTVTIGATGTYTVTLPAGFTGTATNGTAVITGGPTLALTAGGVTTFTVTIPVAPATSGTIIISVTSPAGTVISPLLVATSTAYATDSVVAIADGGPSIQKSTNGGLTWSAFGTPATTVTALWVTDANNIFAGTNDGVYKVGVFSKSTGLPSTASVFSFAMNPKDATKATLLVGMSNGTVYESTNNGVAFTQIGTAAPGGANATVAYAADGTRYAGSTAGGVYRWDGSAWKTTIVSTSIGNVTGLAISTDGTLYASDWTAGNSVFRSLNPTDALAPLAVQLNFAAMGVGTANATPASGFAVGNLLDMVVISGATANSIYAIDNSTTNSTYLYAGRIRGFSDTLFAAPAITAPKTGTTVAGTTSTTLSWPAVAGAYQYTPTINTTVGPLQTGLTYSATNLGEGSTNTWSVMVSTPIPSRPSALATFNTSLNVVTVLAAQIPANGAVNFPVDGTFSWPASSVAGATYEFVLAEELGNADKFAIIDYSATTPTNAIGPKEALKYNTMYWWRVRAVTATSASAWTTSFFTTAKQPDVTTPTTGGGGVTVTFTNTTTTQQVVQTTLVITQGPANEPIPSGLLWAVIAIGAVLIIAVIVLVVRTRKI